MIKIELVGQDALDYLEYLSIKQIQDKVEELISVPDNKFKKESKVDENIALYEELEKPKRTMWTDADDNQIIYAAEKGSKSEQAVERLALKLGRTDAAIRSRAIKLGFKIRGGRVVK